VEDLTIASLGQRRATEAYTRALLSASLGYRATDRDEAE
jgi:hypothetical protein